MRITRENYKVISTDTCFGLFNSVSGTIKNVIFDRVEINIELDKNNTSAGTPVNIGIITAVNNGSIENCSVNIISSKIQFNSDKSNQDGQIEGAQNTTYRIGLIAGLNNETIKYNNTNIGSIYSYMTDCYSGGKLEVKVESGNVKFDETTNIYIGGAVGENNGTISSIYKDKSDQSVRTLITSVVNIDVLLDYNEVDCPRGINTALGGIVGYNTGTINNVAISGAISVNDKANVGGIAGENAGIIQECGNYGAYIKGYALIEDYSFIYQDGKTKTL